MEADWLRRSREQLKVQQAGVWVNGVGVTLGWSKIGQSLESWLNQTVVVKASAVIGQESELGGTD